MKANINNITIHIQKADLYTIEADAIVNDTDSPLTIPPRLADLTGEAVVLEAQMIGWCDIGGAVATSAGNLSAKRLIHAVSPRWGDDHARGKLEITTWEILNLAEDEQVQSLALPPLATGTNGYPVENCAKVMLEQIIDYTFEPTKYLKRITICSTIDEQFDVFKTEFRRQIDALRAAGDGKVRV